MIYDPESPMHRQLLAAQILSTLTGAGFKEVVTGSRTHERVFYRPVVTEGPNAGRVSIRVYTTITSNSVRTRGEDAIRVCGVYTDRNGKEWGLCKTRRVHRTGKVLDIPARMLDRMREVWTATAKASMVTCGCGAPKFVSKKGNLVCAERCFNRHPSA